MTAQSNAATNPCVDVIIAAWNRADSIERAVRSALSDPAVKRVVVVDDASSDATCDEAERADDGSGRLVVIRLDTNVGPAAARNTAIAASDAPWIAVLDADDYFLPDRVSKLVALADTCDFVADDILQISSDRIGVDQPVAMLSQAGFQGWTCDFETFILGNISVKGRARKELGFFKPLMRRAFLDGHSLRYQADLRLGEDYALYAQALAHGARFSVIPAQGYVSVVRNNSLSALHSKADLEHLRDSDLALEKVRQFSAREKLAIRKHYDSIDARVQWLAVIEGVKAKNLRQCLNASFRSPHVMIFIATRLKEQVIERSLKRTGLR